MKTRVILAIVAICLAVISLGFAIWGLVENYRVSKLIKRSEELREEAEALREKAQAIRDRAT